MYDQPRDQAPLGPPAPRSHGSLDVGLVLPATAPGLGGLLLPATALGLGLRGMGYLLPAVAPDLGRGVTPLGRCPLGMGSSRLLPLTSDVG